MRRKLFTLCSAVSLLLFVAVCVLWVRSYWVADLLRLKEYPWEARLWSVGGSAVIHVAWPTYRSSDESPLPWTTTRPRARAERSLSWENWGGRERRYRFAGFEYRDLSGVIYSRDSRHMCFVPFWAVALALFLPPLEWTRRSFRTRVATSRGRCPACGYDLRATTDRCPECGAAKAEEIEPRRHEATKT